jgi:DNA-binding NarL/FixJ family response regulator
MIRIAIVEDHHLFREGVKLILNHTEGFKIVAEFSNGSEFIDALPNLEVDVVLMDISMPVMDGIEATRLAVSKKPDIKILTLSMHGEEEYYYRMLSSGVKGFILKESKSHELIEAVKWVANGDNYFSQELLRKLVFKFGPKGFPKNKGTIQSTDISSREYDVLKLICQGYTNAEIADKLFISPRTVEGHRGSLLRKTDTKNTVALIMFSLKTGLLKL